MEDNYVKSLIIASVEDAVADLLYYDRKEDEDLSHEDIVEALRTGIVTADMLAEVFRNKIQENL